MTRLAVSVSAALLGLAFASSALAATIAGGAHMMLTPEGAAKTGRVAPDAETAGQMLYYGGSVFSAVKVVSVMWGPLVNPITVAGVPGFSSALVNSTYIDRMGEFSTFLHAVDGRHGTRQHIARGTNLGQVVITPHNTSAVLDDTDVQAELRQQIKAGVLPPRDLNTLYMVYFPTTVSITAFGLRSCVDFGAYHSATIADKLSRYNIFYSVEPDCGSGFSNITYAASHEFAEATTDNVPTPGSSPAYPQAWNNAQGYEVADLCPTTGLLTAAGKTYQVSQFYLNSTGHCSTGNYTSP